MAFDKRSAVHKDTDRSHKNRPATRTTKIRGFDIQQFRSELGQVGVAKTNLFYVTFALPPFLFDGQTDRTLSLLCESTAIPGLQIVTDDSIKRHGVGPTDKRPVTTAFGDLNLSFIGDNNGVILKFFHKWMDFIINFNNDSNETPSYSMSYEHAYPVDIRS